MMKTCLICSAVVGAEHSSCPECGECSFNVGVEPALSAPEPAAEQEPEAPPAPEPAAVDPPRGRNRR